MPLYSDNPDTQIKSSLLKPMLHGEGWKVVLHEVSALILKHEKATASPTVDLYTRLDRIGRTEGMKELLGILYKIADEPSPVVQHLMLPLVPRPVPEEAVAAEGNGKNPWVPKKKRGGSVA